MPATEDQIHAAVLHTMRVRLPSAVIHHARNEGNRGGKAGLRDGARGKRMGVLPGYPDLIVHIGGKTFFVEVKTPTGRISAAQAAIRDQLVGQGFDYWICRSVWDADEVARKIKVAIA